ncbi:MAG: zinc dependent phospholipase C family protein [Cyclobacteriaceae bacterium]|nr:zinc dependent phospholipase C family protein [Cyclobacteriaceae bacterium HetDA_MAG_MS6]
MKRAGLLLLIFVSVNSSDSKTPLWGFFAHEKINRLAVFSLPPEMLGFYKQHIQYLSEKAVNPDKRRYVLPEEASRHYIDLDLYGDSAVYHVPRYWKQAVERYSEDTLKARGIVPWHIMSVKNYLTKAMANRDATQILRLSADLGHYIADANVPLHTTANYNGQLTGQYGIHGFWESRLPELFFEEYDLFVGKAEYLSRPQLEAWRALESAHSALDSVFQFEHELSRKFANAGKYSFEERGASTVRVYAYDFSKAYHRRLQGQVERRLRASIKMVADFWYTCWVDGGQPDLSDMVDLEVTDSLPKVLRRNVKFRNHESGNE